MKFAYTILYVSDVQKSLQFYENALGLTKKFLHESNQYAELATGETTLALVSNDLANTNLPEGFRKNTLNEKTAGMEITFIADDVQHVFDHAMQNGATAVVSPTQKPWGQTIAYVRDLDGILIELASPMK